LKKQKIKLKNSFSLQNIMLLDGKKFPLTRKFYVNINKEKLVA